VTAGGNGSGPKAVAGPTIRATIAIRFADEPGAEPAVDMGDATLADVYLAATMLDMVAGELRLMAVAQAVQRQQQQGLAVVRSLPGRPGGAHA
jgi:hypothetical protein